VRECRSLWREIGNPLSLLYEKSGDGRETQWSGFRGILYGFAIFYWLNWPDQLTIPAVALAACIIFGLPVRNLFARVPVSETLGAIEAFFGNVTGKAAASASAAHSRMDTMVEDKWTEPAGSEDK
jgi:hypothetical protein